MRLRTSLLRAIVLVALAFIIPTGLGCASDRAVIDQANDFHGGLKPAVIRDAELSRYLQAIGDRVIKAARELDRGDFGPKSHYSEDTAWMFSRQMQFHFVNSKTLNAFTTGGEHMYIYTQLFQVCRSEDELAAVVAHEYAHVYSRHVHKGMNRQMTALGIAGAAGVAGYALGSEDEREQYALSFAGAALIAGQFINMGFTRDDEAEADEYGFDFYCRAGWDPNKFGDFFQQLIDKGYDKGPEFLSDHPSLKSRVDEARKRAKAVRPADRPARPVPPVADKAAFVLLQKRSISVGKNLPTDEMLAKSQQILDALPRSCLTPAIQADQKKAQQELAKEEPANRKVIQEQKKKPKKPATKPAK